LIFFLKKIAILLIMPMTVCLVVLGFGVLLLWIRRRIGAARTMLTLGVIVMTALSFNAVANQIIKPLELWYPPLLDAERVKDVNWVVVLGGGHTSNSDFPANAQIENQSLARLVEGIRLHRMLPGSKLLLSGGAVFDPAPEAETMADVAYMLGVSREDMLLETQSKDTHEQAVRIRELLGPKSMVLVTSAVHMPRAMMDLQKAGLRPIPAPVDFSDWMRSQSGPGRFFPRARELKKIESALHEYLGLLWAIVTK
jgi:uncharacterized SAM-binding protein YcdF (DUF218 family)